MSGISAAAATSCEVGGRRASESNTTRRGWDGRSASQALRARRQLRVVGERRADADDHRVDRRAPAVSQLAAVLAADPLRVAGAGRDLAVERHRRLEQHPRAPDARVLAKGLVEQARARGELAVGEHHLHALVAQDPEAAPRGLLGRVVGGDHHPLDARLQDRLGARRRLALVAAGLERHVQRRPAQVGQAARLDRVDLRVHAAELVRASPRPAPRRRGRRRRPPPGWA